MTEKKSICGLTADEIFSLIEPAGYSFSHAILIANFIYKKSVSDLAAIGKIPGRLRRELDDIATSGILNPVSSEISTDGTIKYLFRSENGKEFETVFIPGEKRTTVCVSSQSGCRMGCHFCATGQYGFRGNLSAGEIVSQIISLPGHEEVTHVVFMGMGEPMDNIENVLKACTIITSEWGLAISKRNVTVSTVGILPGTETYLRKSDCNLTLSLLSSFPEERKKLIPSEKLFPAHDIIEIMKHFPLRKKRRLSLAYVMIKDLNDSDRHLEALTSLVKGTAIRVNILPYHPTADYRFTSSSLEQMQYFKHILVTSGISASVRKSRGMDIAAACGLLASRLC